MGNVYEKLKEKNITLPSPPPKGGIYSPVIRFDGNLLYCSGCGPAINGTTCIGKVGGNLSLEEGQTAAYNCGLNLLANLQQFTGDLNKIKGFIKLTGFVNCTDDFSQQSQVINGASALLQDIFGEEEGTPARTAVGTNALPGGIACEIEALLELRKE